MMEILVKELWPEVSQRKEERTWTILRGKLLHQIEADDITSLMIVIKKLIIYKFICFEVIGWIQID